MTNEQIRIRINELIQVKGVQPKYFWKQVGIERSMFCRWRKEERNISQSDIDELGAILLMY